jgi:hypothetical protein
MATLTGDITLFVYNHPHIRMMEMEFTKPTAIGGMTEAELDKELMMGIESMKSGKGYSADEVDVELAKEFGI